MFPDKRRRGWIKHGGMWGRQVGVRRISKPGVWNACLENELLQVEVKVQLPQLSPLLTQLPRNDWPESSHNSIVLPEDIFSSDKKMRIYFQEVTKNEVRYLRKRVCMEARVGWIVTLTSPAVKPSLIWTRVIIICLSANICPILLSGWSVAKCIICLSANIFEDPSNLRPEVRVLETGIGSVLEGFRSWENIFQILFSKMVRGPRLSQYFQD